MEQLREMAHGGDILTRLEQHPGQIFLDFSANINPLGMPESVIEALYGSAAPSLHYPDHHCRILRQELSGYEKVPKDWILCGNGASDLIYRMVFARKPCRAMLLAPTFGEYEETLLQVGCGIEYYPLAPDNHFQVEEDILQYAGGADMVFLCNPNNPNGALMESGLLQRLLEQCGQQGTLMVVDECFLEFVEDGEAYSLKKFLLGFPRLIILRAFTKIFAMPGIRLGYALCADRSFLAEVDRAGPPWSVSVPAQLCGIAATGERDFVARTVKLVAEERAYLSCALAELGCRVFPASANYLLFYTSCHDLADRLLHKGIIIRDCNNYRQLSSGYFRVAVRTSEENHRLITAVKECLACRQ